MKATEILRQRGFGYTAESDVVNSLAMVWHYNPMPFEEFLNLPLPAYQELAKATSKRVEEDRKFQVELFSKVFGGKKGRR